MLYTLRELECKDVINLCDGRFMGHICDLEIDADCGRITALFVNEHGSFWSSSKDELRVDWGKIRCIGEDAVLVEVRQQECDACRIKTRKRWLQL